MNEIRWYEYARKRLACGKEVTVSVGGSSMFPVFQEGDFAVIQRKEAYGIGDILLFPYREEGLLLHRLIATDGENCCCKGDNSFRVEVVQRDSIWGSACYRLNKGKREALRCPDGLPEASLAVNRFLKENGYSRDKLFRSELYRQYREKYLEGRKEHEVQAE